MIQIRDLSKPPAVNLECKSCGECFNVHISAIKSKKSIICPNCEQEMNEVAFNEIKTAATSLSKALYVLAETNEDGGIFGPSESSGGFSFSISWAAKLPYGDGSGTL